MIGRIFLVFPIGIFLWAAWEVFQTFAEAISLRSGVGRLIENPLIDKPFPGSTTLQKRAAAIARKTQQAKAAAQIHPDREIASITAEFSSRLGRTRALAGLLIIIGLLITLLNLRSAVEEMKVAVGPTRTATSPISPVGPSNNPDTISEVNRAMANIAAAAGRAFNYSGISISLAATVLFFSIIAQTRATAAVREFTAWMLHRHDELLATQDEEPQDTPAKLAHAAQVLVQVAATFRDTNSALADLKGFGDKLASAATEISAAVADLPTQLDNSMNRISGDVAAGIRTGLEHQAQYLSSLVAIYSEHAILVEKTIGFISQMTDANKKASQALVDLGTLPKAIQDVASSTAQVRATSQELTTAVHSLDTRVAALPAGDLTKAATQLTDAAGRLIQLEKNVAAMLETVRSLFKSAIDDATKRNSDALVQELEKLSSGLQKLKTEVTAEAAKHSTELKTSLTQLKANIDKLTATDGSGGIESLSAQLKSLIQDVESLPSLQIKRMFGVGKSNTERP